MKLRFPPLGNARVVTRLGGGAWLAALGGKGGAAHTDRLRDVLSRDRALAAVRPSTALVPSSPGTAAASAPAGPAVSPPAAPAQPQPVEPSPPVPLETSSPGASSSEERPQRVQNEPIRTRTMARLLAAQGYRLRALAIYDELLARPGADDSLRREAETLRSRCA